MIPVIDEALITAALEQAAEWQRQANHLLTPAERRQQEQLLRLLDHPLDKVVLTKLFDQGFRSNDPVRIADQIHHLLKRYGTPEFLSTTEKALMLLFQGVGRHLPAVAVPKMIAKLRENSRHLVISGEPAQLREYLEKRRQEGVRVNLNHLGEAVLGEKEAAQRLESYLADLSEPLIEYISVKISTIYSQIQPLAFEHCVTLLSERLARLYRAARKHTFTHADGRTTPKFVNLDMEEFRDLRITVAAFRATLERTEFKDLTAGIVLQAYLPESYQIQQELTDWARRRVADGGAPIKIRIVKGANMEMEQIEAALHNWPLAPFDNKADVDANYKRMALFGLQPQNAAAVHLGIASHNLFELAFARHVARTNGVEAYMVFEMLEGMADHVRRAMSVEGLPLLLYAPVADSVGFLNAIGYLLRRMDENTGPHNFLRYMPFLDPAQPIWQKLADDFRQSCRRLADLPATPQRRQDRRQESLAEIDEPSRPRFENEPDTDWALPANLTWAAEIRDRWRKSAQDAPLAIPLVIAGREIVDQRPTRAIVDVNQWPAEVVVARYHPATAEELAQAVTAAQSDPDGWRSLSLDERAAILARAAQNLRRLRGDLIGAAAAATAKIFSEADSEVSEAIDFTEYYPRAVRTFTQRANLRVRGKGVGLVIAPWNFPIAIPCGGIAAALAAGNTVIFKPSSDAVLTAWLLCQAFWQAGVGRNALQFVPCAGAAEGQRLAADRRVDFTILTGGTATALQILAARPDLYLAAETGGKNATIVTALADREQAVKNVLQSAFGHAGQKCSATSLLILEKEVYDDPRFRETLVDAAASWPTGSVWDFATRLNPLIRPPAGALQRALTTLEEGEQWALQPRNVDGQPQLWTPGIKWGVQPGSFTHLTELFGPVLAVMRADSLKHAVALANQTGYGLTAGLESLDDREIAYWQKHIRAGNLYINRGTTGAITLRQPFGGLGKSAVGPAIKAGGPDYVAQFMNFEEIVAPPVGAIPREDRLLALAQRWRRKAREGQVGNLRDDLIKFAAAVESYLYHAQTDFEGAHDYFHLRGQDNLLRHRPAGKVAVDVHPDDRLFEIAARVAAARIAGCATVLNLPPGCQGAAVEFLQSGEGQALLEGVELWRLSPAELAGRVALLDRLRYAAPERVPAEVWQSAARSGTYIARAPVLRDGRVELLHYYIGLSVCDSYHRYGNLGERAALHNAV